MSCHGPHPFLGLDASWPLPMCHLGKRADTKILHASTHRRCWFVHDDSPFPV